MYRIEDKVGAIKELQRLLRLNPTGSYDENTRKAVLKVQKKYALEQTGIADYQTFIIIVEEYRLAKSNKWINDYLFLPNFPYEKGNMDDNVGRINDAIRIVLSNYVYEGILPIGKYFGDNTVNGVRFLRKIFGLDESDMIDKELMNRILLERRGIETKSNHGL